MSEAAPEPWFPDYVASWYDELPQQLLDDHYYEWWEDNAPEIVGWVEDLIQKDPHRVAQQMDEWVTHARDRTRARYRALRASAHAIEWAGIRPVRNRCGDGWHAIRRRWLRTGTLTTERVPGLLVPCRERPFSWPGARRLHKSYDRRHHFPSFLRWRGDGSLDVSVNVIPGLEPELQRAVECGQLRCAVVPLVSSIDKLEFLPIDDEGPRRFQVTLRDPQEIARLAEESLRAAIEAGAHLVVFPELCLTREVQLELGNVVREASRGRVWLVVAGSALTGKQQNQSVVFDGNGRPVLGHNKLFKYSMSPDEQLRYGVLLDRARRVEDIHTQPRELRLLETDLGRVAVLICEDLTATNVFSPVFDSLEVDLVIAPLMDGPQLPERWPGNYASFYASTGTSVITATTQSLVEAHRLHERAQNKAESLASMALHYSRNAHWQPEAVVLSAEPHSSFVMFTLR